MVAAGPSRFGLYMKHKKNTNAGAITVMSVQPCKHRGGLKDRSRKPRRELGHCDIGEIAPLVNQSRDARSPESISGEMAEGMRKGLDRP